MIRLRETTDIDVPDLRADASLYEQEIDLRIRWEPVWLGEETGWLAEFGEAYIGETTFGEAETAAMIGRTRMAELRQDAAVKFDDDWPSGPENDDDYERETDA